ncbi:hypothetical protein [Streptomyces sp. DSM 118878]
MTHEPGAAARRGATAERPRRTVADAPARRTGLSLWSFPRAAAVSRPAGPLPAQEFDFMEDWFDVDRLHGSLGYLSPAEYEAALAV